MLITSMAFGQSDLVLYTKKGCIDCNRTKAFFNISGINFKECPISDPANVEEMAAKLKAIGHNGKSYLPMIILNGKVMFPIHETDAGLKHWSLDDAMLYVDANWKGNRNASRKVIYTDDEGAECEAPVNNYRYSLVLKNCNSKAQAEAYLKTVKGKYPKAGVLVFRNTYKVYSEDFADSRTCKAYLIKVKKAFPKAYMLRHE